MSERLTNTVPDTPDDGLDDFLQSLRLMAISSQSLPVAAEQQPEQSIANIEAQCCSYLDDQLCHNSIRLDTGEYKDVLEIEASPNSHSIQQFVNDHNRHLNIIHLSPPAPRILPICILDIFENDDSYIIPSDPINIQGFLFPTPQYRLEAVVCLSNRRRIVYFRHWPTKQWYYHQSNSRCTRLNDELNQYLNSTIESRSFDYQKQMVESADILLTVIFRNAIKYFYKPMT